MSRHPVVALHSLFFDGSMFDDIAVLTGRAIIAPDHRGQGARSAEAPGDVDALADDVCALVQDLEEPVHLVGSSMGAYVAMVAAARLGDRVRTCTLSAATADAERRPEVFAALVAQLRDPGPAARVDLLAQTMFGSAFLETDGDRCRHWRERFARLEPSVADAAELVFERRDLWDDVRMISAPLRLLAGGLDRAKSPADMQRISDEVGCPPPLVLSRSGHTPFVEQPREVAEALASFWATHEE
ncbi:alpha/beta fold hydrolase [Aeromicrobium camelliae]|uniref:Alpha/beta fold hydrolase n=1 Tax=Aeromicrobium camelliae TaxID=1538144 RepID=A0A3N6ZQI1_9ACTN|nr:alpha/beta hydrolase [Aeromicrobium camelliae]RQN09317.1 alpha/beta fold hydrolase [Aeromicrobium camelliae]